MRLDHVSCEGESCMHVRGRCRWDGMHLEERDEGGRDGAVAVDLEAKGHVEGHREAEDDDREEEREEDELEPRDLERAKEL